MVTCRWAVPLVQAAAIVLAIIGLAGALDVLPLPPDPNPGVFRRPGAPVYADAPDGWACHYLGTNERLVGKRCTAPEEWAAHKPRPVWRSGRLDEAVDDVICQRGQFSLIQSARGRGWAASTAVSTNAFRRDGHSLVDGCDAFTWS